MSNNAELIRTTTFGFSSDRAVRLAVNLHCPRCGIELTANDVAADRFSAVVVECGACRYVVLAVS